MTYPPQVPRSPLFLSQDEQQDRAAVVHPRSACFAWILGAGIRAGIKPPTYLMVQTNLPFQGGSAQHRRIR